MILSANIFKHTKYIHQRILAGLRDAMAILERNLRANCYSRILAALLSCLATSVYVSSCVGSSTPPAPHPHHSTITTALSPHPPAPSPHPQEAGRRANIGRRPPCWLVRDQSEGPHHHQGSVPSSLMYSSSSICIKVEDGQAQLAASLTVELNKGDPFS